MPLLPTKSSSGKGAARDRARAAKLRKLDKSTKYKVGKNATKKKKKKPIVDVKDLVPQVKLYEPSTLRSLKADALRVRKSNPQNGNSHIRVIETKLVQNGVLTAGYFGVHSTNDLKEYAMRDDVALALAKFNDLKIGRFGLPKSIAFSPTTFFKNLSGAIPGSKFLEALMKLEFTDNMQLNGGASGNLICYINWAIVCLKILKVPVEGSIGDFPRFSPDSEVVQLLDDDEKFLGYTWEDWNRALAFVRWFEKSSLDNRKDTRSRAPAATKIIASIPNYLTEEDLSGGAVVDDNLSDEDEEDDSAEQRNRKQAHRFYKASAALSEYVTRNLPSDVQRALQTNIEEVSSKQFLTNIEVLEKTLTKTFQHKSRSVLLPSTRVDRPRLGEKDAFAFCEVQGKRADVLWGPDDIDKMRKEAIDKLAGAEATTLNIGDLQNTAMIAENLGQDVDADDANDADENLGEDAQTKLLWDLRAAMGTQSAPIPGYLDSCRWASVDPESLVINKSIANRNGKKPSYKNHQLPTAYFMASAEQGPVHGTIIAVACGLGKTLSTLAMIKFSNDAQRKAGEEDPDVPQVYAASIVCCPGASVEVWQADMEKFYPGLFTIHQFYGTTFSITNPARLQTLVTPPSIQRLNEILSDLDPHNPQTGLTIILTAHTTWYIRSLGTVLYQETGEPIFQPLVEEEDVEEFIEENEFIDDDEDEVNVEPELEEDSESKSESESEPEDGDENDEDDDDSETIREARHEGREFRRAERLNRFNAEMKAFREKQMRKENKKKRDAKGKKSEQAKVNYEKMHVYTSLCTYKFVRMVVDEAHALRNPGTLLAEAVVQTQKGNLHCLSATPMLNHAKDLRGYLHQFFKGDWEIQATLGFLEQYDDDFDPFNFIATDDFGSAHKVDIFPPKTKETKELHDAQAKGVKLYLLNPKQYASCGRNGGWNASTTKRIMPPVLKMLMLRIGYETMIDLENGQPPQRVGGAIPRCDFYSVQLQMNPLEKEAHDKHTLHVLALLGIGDLGGLVQNSRVAQTQAQLSNLEGIKDEGGIINMGAYRLVKHATFDPNLALVTELNHSDMTKAEKAQASKDRVNNWTGLDLDHGASYFFLRTRAGPQYNIPQDRLSLAIYLSAMSVKMRFALGLLAQKIKMKKKTVLVFEFPMTLWDCEAQLDNLGFKYVALKSSQTQEERTKFIAQFNDKDSDIMILLVTTALGSVSLNLQKASACIIVMEIPISFYILMQVLGRINRIGQEEMQQVYLLWINYSYDQIALNRMFKKIVPSLAGEGTAADSLKPEEVAERQVQLFLGMKHSHTPYAEVWGQSPYTAKDRLVEALETEEATTEAGQADEGGDSFTDPITPVKGTAKKAGKVSRTTMHSQNIATCKAHATGSVQPLLPSRSKRKASDMDDVPEESEDESETGSEPAILKKLQELEAIRAKLDNKGLKGKARTNTVSKYKPLFGELQDEGSLRGSDRMAEYAGFHRADFQKLNLPVPDPWPPTEKAADMATSAAKPPPPKMAKTTPNSSTTPVPAKKPKAASKLKPSTKVTKSAKYVTASNDEDEVDPDADLDGMSLEA